MSIQRISTQEFLQLSKSNLVLDVRSPGEFIHGRIPGAVSLPLFSDEERKLVGTAYKQQSREAAIKIGLDFFGPKMRKMVEEVEMLYDLHQKNHQETIEHNTRMVLVHCWRGGMRSGAVAWLLDLYGFRIFTLSGGYKAYRTYVLKTFELPYRFTILGGYTGTGKTEVLQELGKSGERVIDLEQLASHKGSAFGSYKMGPQPTQEMFENLLADKLIENAGTVNTTPSIWLEDESQRIGNLNIPNALWSIMRSSPILFLEVAFEKRLNHIVEEYGGCDRGHLISSVQRISKRLGPLETKLTLEYLSGGNSKEAFRILLQYYDKRYLKGLHNREDLSSILTKVPCEEVSRENARLLSKYQLV